MGELEFKDCRGGWFIREILEEYDMMIQSSNQTIYCNLNLTLSQLQMLNICTPKLLFNQPVLIERIKCKIGIDKFEITETVFRTLREYQD